jgi:hypothetical protein
MNYAHVCSQEVGYRTEKVIKCLQNSYHQAFQASFINKGGSKFHKDQKDHTAHFPTTLIGGAFMFWIASID